MAYKVIILYRLYMPSYVLGTFTEYPYVQKNKLPASEKSEIRTTFCFLLYSKFIYSTFSPYH